MARQLDPTIIALNETFLKFEDTASFPGNSYRADRADGREGVAIFVKKGTMLETIDIDCFGTPENFNNFRYKN